MASFSTCLAQEEVAPAPPHAHCWRQWTVMDKVLRPAISCLKLLFCFLLALGSHLPLKCQLSCLRVKLLSCVCGCGEHQEIMWVTAHSGTSIQWMPPPLTCGIFITSHSPQQCPPTTIIWSYEEHSTDANLDPLFRWGNWGLQHQEACPRSLVRRGSKTRIQFSISFSVPFCSQML
jgi:hypothetical protein